VDQARQHARGVGAAAEAEQIDLVAVLIVVDQELIRCEHLVIEAIAQGEPQDGAEILLEFEKWIWPRQRADAGIVEHELARLCLLGLAQAAIELEDVGNVLADLVPRTVAANDDVFHLLGLSVCGGAELDCFGWLGEANRDGDRGIEVRTEGEKEP